jgi:hypothetical protein
MERNYSNKNMLLFIQDDSHSYKLNRYIWLFKGQCYSYGDKINYFSFRLIDDVNSMKYYSLSAYAPEVNFLRLKHKMKDRRFDVKIPIWQSYSTCQCFNNLSYIVTKRISLIDFSRSELELICFLFVLFFLLLNNLKSKEWTKKWIHFGIAFMF